MTETSPASFMTFTDDPIVKRLSTVGKILPHTQAKIINGHGEIVPMGSRGELCIAGFALQKGYWRNPQKTAEVMRTDQEGVLWMHTGDEAAFDEDGYCRITGRIKDIIIRGLFDNYPAPTILIGAISHHVQMQVEKTSSRSKSKRDLCSTPPSSKPPWWVSPMPSTAKQSVRSFSSAYIRTNLRHHSCENL